MRTSFDSLLSQVLGVIRPQIAEKNLRYTQSIDPAVPEVELDPSMIERVMTNLLSNALKYTREGGTIELSARFNREESTVEVSVKDSGMGLSAENLPNVFEKFYRVPGESAKMRGTGLGLAISKQIVESHGGKIWVESDGLGKGSKFTFTLPLS